MKKIFLFSFIILSHQFLTGKNCVAQSAVKNSSQEIGYNIVDRIHLDGDGGWDCLTIDEATQRLFVSHGNMVQVVDLNTKKVVHTIEDTKGVHGIAIANDAKKGYISNGKDSSVTIFNLSDLSTVGKVAVTGGNPDIIVYDAFSHSVFVFNGRGHNATVINTVSDKVSTTIPLGGKPEFAVSDGNGKIYVNIEDKNLIAVINAKDMKVDEQWPLATGDEPSGLAIDTRNHRLFSVCGNKQMIILNTDNGKIIATLPIGERVDGVDFDPSVNRAYSSNGDGTLTVVQELNPNSFKVLTNVSTQKGARTIALDKKTHHIYLPTADYQPIAEGQKRPSIKPGTFVILDVEEVK